MMVEIIRRNTEREIGKNINRFSLKSKAKDYRTWMIAQIGKFTKNQKKELLSNYDAEALAREFKRAYDFYEPEQTLEVEIEAWHGKSSFEVIEEADRYIMIKFQRKQKGDEPQEVRTEATKQEMAVLRDTIKSLWKGEPLETKDLAMQWCMKMDIFETTSGRKLFGSDNFWVEFFAWRKMHNKFTLMLGALDYWDEITYKGGKIWVR